MERFMERYTHVGAVITIKSPAWSPKLVQPATDNLPLVPCHFNTPGISLTLERCYLVSIKITPPFDKGWYQILSALSPSAPRTEL